MNMNDESINLLEIDNLQMRQERGRENEFYQLVSMKLRKKGEEILDDLREKLIKLCEGRNIPAKSMDSLWLRGLTSMQQWSDEDIDREAQSMGKDMPLLVKRAMELYIKEFDPRATSELPQTLTGDVLRSFLNGMVSWPFFQKFSCTDRFDTCVVPFELAIRGAMYQCMGNLDISIVEAAPEENVNDADNLDIAMQGSFGDDDDQPPDVSSELSYGHRGGEKVMSPHHSPSDRGKKKKIHLPGYSPGKIKRSSHNSTMDTRSGRSEHSDTRSVRSGRSEHSDARSVRSVRSEHSDARSVHDTDGNSSEEDDNLGESV